MSSVSDRGVLHLLSSSERLSLPSALLRALSPADTLVLISDAVTLALAGSAMDWARLPVAIEVLVLQTDLERRGLGERSLHSRIQRSDDLAWVIASERHARSLSWGSGR